MKRKTALFVFVILAISACASMRKFDVGSGADASRISVYNSHTSMLTVSYTDSGGKTHELGTVNAGSTVPFAIPGAAGSTVTLSGMTASGGHYEKSATLGSTTKLTL